jgi:hypothetical protein
LFYLAFLGTVGNCVAAVFTLTTSLPVALATVTAQLLDRSFLLFFFMEEPNQYFMATLKSLSASLACLHGHSLALRTANSYW